MKHLLLATLVTMNSMAFAEKFDPYAAFRTQEEKVVKTEADYKRDALNRRFEPYQQSGLETYSELSGIDMSVYEAPVKDNFVAGPVRQTSNTNSYFIPFDITGKELLKLAAASSVAVMFFANDDEIMDFTQKHKNDITESLAYAGEAFGSEWGAGIAGAGLIIGIVMKNQEVKHVSIMAAKAMLVSGLATRALKIGIDRTRPKNAETAYEYGMGNHSFPSGHTTQAFALATVIAEAYKDRGAAIPILAYSAAAIAGWSRVHDKAHWASDVVVGGLIGHLVAKNMMNSKLTDKGFTIVPNIGLHGDTAISVTYTGKAPKLKCGKDLEDVDAFRDCMEKALSKNASERLF